MTKTEQLIETAKRVQLGNYRPAPLVLSEGRGVRVRDVDGQEFLDLSAGLAVTSVGHGHPKLAKAIGDQAARLMHVSNLWYNDRAIELAEKLTARTGFDRVFFCNSGTEANEALLKLARHYHFGAGHPERVGIVSTIASFHGRTMGALTLTGQPKYHEGMGPLVGGVSHVPYGDLAAMRAAVNEATAAIIVEPIQAEGGIFVPGPGYLDGAARAVRRARRAAAVRRGPDWLRTHRDVPRRRGRRASSRTPARWPRASPAASRSAPSCCSEKLAGALPPGTHASTFGGNALACAAGLATLAIFDEEHILENVVARGNELSAACAADRERRRPVWRVAVRGRGLLQGIVLAAGVDPMGVLARLRAGGVLATLAGGNVATHLPRSQHHQRRARRGHGQG